MDMECEHCGHRFNRDKKINDIIVEEYSNIYGTFCPKCGKKNESLVQLKYIEENNIKRDLLRVEFLDKLRNKLKGK